MADKAILYGINDYATIRDLRGCINDTELIQQLLIHDYGFNEDDIRIRHDAEVTKTCFEGDITWLTQDTEPNDRLVIHFSGHGSYVPSDNDDEAVDELICLHGMDWHDPTTYLVDDDLGDLLHRLPSHADITVILDCCHSGTGTRAVTRSGEASPTLDALASLPVAGPHPVEGEVIPPEARFVPPPPEFRRPESQRRRSMTRSALNHLLLAGARDHQTAADAFIDDDYYGAFSYYLCATAAENPDATASEIMTKAITEIASEGYSQVPQIEGINQKKVLFGGGRFLQNSPSMTEETISSQAGTEETLSGKDLDAVALLHRMLDVSEKFIDLADRILPQNIEKRIGHSRDLDQDVYVAVHGISSHPAGYSKRWFDALSPHLTQPMERMEVLWSDIVNKRNLPLAEIQGEAELREAIAQELERRTEEIRERTEGRAANVQERAIIDDFLRYMLHPPTREKILRRFDNILRPLLQTNRNVHIISHSWGAVVAYEGLRRLEEVDGLTGMVETFFTVGAPLSISAVRTNLFSRVDDGSRPDFVEKWFNLDAVGDIVGGRLLEHFDISREYLKLSPYGCKTFLGYPLNVSCAHSSYFNPGNTTVNRGIFARYINP